MDVGLALAGLFVGGIVGLTGMVVQAALGAALLGAAASLALKAYLPLSTGPTGRRPVLRR